MSESSSPEPHDLQRPHDSPVRKPQTPRSVVPAAAMLDAFKWLCEDDNYARWTAHQKKETTRMCSEVPSLAAAVPGSLAQRLKRTFDRHAKLLAEYGTPENAPARTSCGLHFSFAQIDRVLNAAAAGTPLRMDLDDASSEPPASLELPVSSPPPSPPRPSARAASPDVDLPAAHLPKSELDVPADDMMWMFMQNMEMDRELRQQQLEYARESLRIRREELELRREILHEQRKFQKKQLKMHRLEVDCQKAMLKKLSMLAAGSAFKR